MDTLNFGHSPVEKVLFQGHELYIKRDDLLGSLAFNGNKARKLHYYLCNDFPEITKVISYGSAQSNMLYSLSVLAKLKGWQLDFYVDHIAKNLRECPRGNYAEALANGANLHEVGAQIRERTAPGADSTEDYVLKHVLPNATGALYIPEGGRNQQSEFGLKHLADELIGWIEEQNISSPKLMLPSGTGTTALFLQKHLPFEVLTCACVGGNEYLKKQFSELSDNPQHHPTILSLSHIDQQSPSARSGGIYKKQKHHFGKLYPESFDIWQELLDQTGITFELLYDPVGWLSLLPYLQTSAGRSANLIYLHQGGLLGNETMLSRYKRSQHKKGQNKKV